MSFLDLENRPKENKGSINFLNFALLLGIVYLVYLVVQKHYQTNKIERPYLKVCEYGYPAYIGYQLNQLEPFDVKLPLRPGVFVVLESDGHMIIETKDEVMVKLENSCAVEFRSDGVNIIEGKVFFNTTQSTFPDNFHVYHKGRPLSLPKPPFLAP